MNELTRVENPLSILLADPKQLKEIPADTVRELWEIKKEVDDREAKIEYHLAFNRVQKNIPNIVKRGWNSFKKYKYALVEDIVDKLNPVLVEHGFSWSVSTRPSTVSGLFQYVLLLRHIGGHQEEHCMDAPSDMTGDQGGANKTAIQGLGSTYKYCQRYLLCNTFGLVLTDEDNDGEPVANAEKITEKQVSEIHDWISATNGSVPKFLAWKKINSISDMTIEQYDRSVIEFKRKRGEL